MSDDGPIRRRPRSDGRRNRERLIEVTHQAFRAGEFELPLEEVARRAGVGIGTLYRHFPERDALIAAVYSGEIEQLGEAATRLAASRPPIEALREWMRLFLDHIATKQLIAPALNGMAGGPGSLYRQSTEIVQSAITDLVQGAVEAGDMRPDLDPMDLLRALAGVASLSAAPDWQASALRLVDILIAGSRPGAAGASG